MFPAEVITVDTRELKALEIAARTKIAFEMAPIGSPAYDVIVTSPAGSEIFRKTFEPSFVERSESDVRGTSMAHHADRGFTFLKAASATGLRVAVLIACLPS